MAASDIVVNYRYNCDAFDQPIDTSFDPGFPPAESSDGMSLFYIWMMIVSLT